MLPEAELMVMHVHQQKFDYMYASCVMNCDTRQTWINVL